jgi:hypothetical protein
MSYFTHATDTLTQTSTLHTDHTMNTTSQITASNDELALDDQFLRDLADIEIVLVGGGEILGTGA